MGVEGGLEESDVQAVVLQQFSTDGSTVRCKDSRSSACEKKAEVIVHSHFVMVDCSCTCATLAGGPTSNSSWSIPATHTHTLTCLQCTPKSSILSRGMVWYSPGPSSGALYPCTT